MKILQVMRAIHRHGGIARVVFELSRNMAQTQELHQLTNYTDLEIPGQTHHYPLIKHPLFLQIGMNAWQTERHIHTLRERYKFDIVHTHDAESLIGDINTRHSCYKAVLEKFKSERDFKYNLLKMLDPRTQFVLDIERQIVNNCKHMIAVSNKIKQEIMSNYQISSEKITVIPNGVNTEEFNPKNRVEYFHLRLKYHIKPTDKLILFVGNEFQRKGLQHVIDCLPILRAEERKIKLLVVGNDNPEPFIKQAKQLGVYPHVIFTKTADINQYYALADVFAFPTEYEPFGLVITEAMASGLPVVVTEDAGAAELITDGRDGLLLKKTDNLINLCDLIKKAIDHPEIGLAARKTALNYSWDNITQQTLQLYEKWKT